MSFFSPSKVAVKKINVECENGTFKSRWNILYYFLCIKGAAVRIVCDKNIAVLKDAMEQSIFLIECLEVQL